MMNTKLSTVVMIGTPTEKPCRRTWGLSRILPVTALLALIIVATYNVCQLSSVRQRMTWASPSEQRRLPALELHIMPKCPNALHALTELILPTMQRVHDKVDFRLSMVVREISEDGSSIQCLHGPGECEASAFELCAQEQLYPDTEAFVAYMECVTADYHSLPGRNLFEECAFNHTVDLAPIDRCMGLDDGLYSHHLLLESGRHTRAVGVRISGTIRLKGQIYCIRDGDNWTNCPNGPGVEELIEAIEKSYDEASLEL